MWGPDCGHDLAACNCYARSSGVAQSLEEVSFTRSACHAAQLGQVAKLERILKLNPAAVSSDGGSGSSGYTPLHYAARAGQVEAVKVLLRHGAAVDAATVQGRGTSLHRAAVAGSLPVVQLLLAHGADGMLQDADGETALHKAAAQGHKDVVACLLEACPAAQALRDRKGLTPCQRATGAAVALLRAPDASPA